MENRTENCEKLQAPFCFDERSTGVTIDGETRIKWRYENIAGEQVTAWRSETAKLRYEPQGRKRAGAPWLPLYASQLDLSKPVIVCEGEKTTDALWEAGIQATTWCGGSSDKGSVVACADHLARFGFEAVYLWGDNDEAGDRAMYALIDALNKHGVRAYFYKLESMKRGADAADVSVQERREVLEKLIEMERQGIEAPTAAEREAGNPRVTEWLRNGAEGPLLLTEGMDKPKHARSAEGLAGALSDMGVEVRLNVRAKTEEWRRLDGGWAEAPEAWETLDDYQRADFIEEIAKRFITGKKDTPLRFATATFRHTLQANLNRLRVDPFKEYIESLPKWDGENRLHTWLGKAFDTTESDPNLVAWASAFPLLGAIWRTYKPGLKLDEIPVLISKVRGIGKSAAFAALIPESNREWFSDELKLSGDDKDRIEAMQGRVIVEIGEMRGGSRAEIEGLKAFMSRCVDRKRLSYRRDPEDMPRMCVFVGTSNGHCLPNDASGNRNFVAIRLKARDQWGMKEVREFVNSNRDQLWAEALHNFNAGREAWLSPDLAEAQASANDKERIANDMLENAVAKALQGAELPITTEEVIQRSGLTGDDPMARLSQNVLRAISDCLEGEHGLIKRKRRLRKGDKSPRWCWGRD